MKNKIIKLLCLALSSIFLVQTVFASDPNIDGSGGDLGHGSNDNGWAISSTSGGLIYDADGLRVYIVNSSTGTPVSGAIDITNYNIAEENVWNGREKAKYEYKHIDSTINLNRAYQKVKIDTTRTAQLPRIISNDLTASEASNSARIEALKNWFDERAYVDWVLEQLGFTFPEMQAGGYLLSIEPIAYFRYQGYNYAMTATECALFDQLAGGALTSKMGPLTRQNLPLSLFLERDAFIESSYRINAWGGTKNSYVANDDIIRQLGIGYINYFAEEERRETEGSGTYSYPANTWVVTSFRLCNVRASGGNWINGYPITSRNPSSARITINGTAYNISNIYIPSGSEQLIWVKWKTPSTPRTVTATVTCSKGYLYNTQNSGASNRYVTSIAANITIFNNDMEKTPPDPTLNDTLSSIGYNSGSASYGKNYMTSSLGNASNSWVVWDCNFQLERTYTQTYNATNRYPNYPTGNTYDEPTGIYTERSVINTYSHTYSGEYYHYTVYYVVVQFKEYKYRYNRINYNAEVKTSYIKILPDSHCPTAYTQNYKTYMKSGYGINAEVEMYIKITVYYEKTGQTTTDTYYSASSTNYAAAPQYVFAYFPEFNYSTTYNRQFEYYNNKYVFRKNKYSTYYDRTHYTPWWFPDNANYEIVTRCDYAYTPAGKMNIYGASGAIVIEGNLMDDWVISPTR